MMKEEGEEERDKPDEVVENDVRLEDENDKEEVVVVEEKVLMPQALYVVAAGSRDRLTGGCHAQL